MNNKLLYIIFIYYTYIKYEIFLFKIINNIFPLNTNLKI